MSGTEYYKNLVNGNHSKAVKILDAEIQRLEEQLEKSNISKEFTQQLKQQTAQLYCNKAQVFVQLELVKKAGESFYKAIELNSNLLQAHLGIAELLSKSKFKFKNLNESRQAAIQHLDTIIGNISISTSPEIILKASNLYQKIKQGENNNEKNQILQNDNQKSQQIQSSSVNSNSNSKQNLNQIQSENSSSSSSNQIQDTNSNKQKNDDQIIEKIEKNQNKNGKNFVITMNQQQIRDVQQSLQINAQNALENTDGAVAKSAVELVNQGRLVEAETLLNKELQKNPQSFGALLARGTCFAVQGRYEEAEVDFRGAIEIIPGYMDAHRRRAQVLTALGKLEDAIKEFDTAIELTIDPSECAYLYLERGKAHQGRRNLQRAHSDFLQATKVLKNQADLWDYLGVTRTALGDIDSALEAFEQSIQLKPDVASTWLHKATTLKESARTEEADKAIDQVIKIEKQNGDARCTLLALKLRGSMRQWQGQHKEAAKVLNEAIKMVKSSPQQSRLELLAELHYLRAVCLMAHGKFSMARRDFDECLEVGPKVAILIQQKHLSLQQQQQSLIESQQVGQQMFLAWYMRELSSYYSQRQDEPVEDWSMDRELPPLFKQGWCRKELVNEELVRKIQVTWPVTNFLNIQKPNKDPPDSTILLPLLDVAEKIGRLVQYNHRGFFSNNRQQLAIGFAAIELAQALQSVLQSRAKGKYEFVRLEGSSKQGTPQQENNKQQQFGWRDAMDIIVKWRQIAEPNDQVLWVDGLTEEAFKQGFGSHTPMFSGQTKCMRYYSRFPRAFKLFKSIAINDGFVRNAKDEKIFIDAEKVQAADDCSTMWKAVNKTNCYAVVKIQSEFYKYRSNLSTNQGEVVKEEGEDRSGVAENDQTKDRQQQIDTPTPTTKGGVPTPTPIPKEGVDQQEDNTKLRVEVLEGTRLTLTSGDDDSGFGIPEDNYEFSIRTPVTPPRWKLFDAELTHAFQCILQSTESDDKINTARQILRFVYYWYNFMPLARGSAACGYASLLGMFLALDMPISTCVPQGVQVDWEAILSTSPDEFVSAIESWLMPQKQNPNKQFEQWRSFPLVKDVLGTIRKRIYVLDYPNGVWDVV